MKVKRCWNGMIIHQLSCSLIETTTHSWSCIVRCQIHPLLMFSSHWVAIVIINWITYFTYLITFSLIYLFTYSLRENYSLNYFITCANFLSVFTADVTDHTQFLQHHVDQFKFLHARDYVVSGNIPVTSCVAWESLHVGIVERPSFWINTFV